MGGCFKPNFVLVSLGFLLICSAPTGLSINSNYKNESSQTQLPILGSGCLCNRWGQGSGCVTKSSDGAQRPYSVPVLTAPSCPHSRGGAYLRRKRSSRSRGLLLKCRPSLGPEIQCPHLNPNNPLVAASRVVLADSPPSSLFYSHVCLLVPDIPIIVSSPLSRDVSVHGDWESWGS